MLIIDAELFVRNQDNVDRVLRLLELLDLGTDIYTNEDIEHLNKTEKKVRAELKKMGETKILEMLDSGELFCD